MILVFVDAFDDPNGLKCGNAFKSKQICYHYNIIALDLVALNVFMIFRG